MKKMIVDFILVITNINISACGNKSNALESVCMESGNTI